MAKRYGKRKYYKKRRGRGKFRARKRYARSKIFKRRVGRVIDSRAEKKWGTISQGSTYITNAGQALLLWNSLATGTSDQSRIGAQIRIKNIRLHITLENTGATFQESKIRIVLGCYRQYQTGTPSISSEFQTATEVQSLYDRYKLEAKRWTPIWDRNINMGAQLTAGTNNTACIYRKFLRLNLYGRRLPMKRQDYSGGGIPNMVYVIYIWGSGVVGPTFPSWILNGRYTYVDY